MKRSNLKNIIRWSAVSAGCEPIDVERLVATADQTDRIAVGAFETHQCGCPATVAGYYDTDTGDFRESTPDAVKSFPTEFDMNFSFAEKATDGRVLIDVNLDGYEGWVEVEDDDA